MAFTDDASIPNDEELLRRVPPWCIVADQNRAGQKRASSAAFDDPELSVDLASVRRARGEPLTATLAGHEGFGLVFITAGVARAKQQTVSRDPLLDNPAHGIVAGKKTGSVRNHFRDHCMPVFMPT